MHTMQIVQAAIGAALLTFGQKWLPLFLAALGAIAAVAVISTYPQYTSQGAMIAALVAGGVVGFLVAVFIKTVGVVLAGALGGGYAGYVLAQQMGWLQHGFPWIPVVLCAILGIIVAHYSLKWALILLSAVVGAYLIVASFEPKPSVAAPLVIVLAAAGIWFQASSRTSKRGS